VLMLNAIPVVAVVVVDEPCCLEELT